MSHLITIKGSGVSGMYYQNKAKKNKLKFFAHDAKGNEYWGHWAGWIQKQNLPATHDDTDEDYLYELFGGE